jgi:hypothetical protein
MRLHVGLFVIRNPKGGSVRGRLSLLRTLSEARSLMHVVRELTIKLPPAGGKREQNTTTQQPKAQFNFCFLEDCLESCSICELHRETERHTLCSNKETVVPFKGNSWPL